MPPSVAVVNLRRLIEAAGSTQAAIARGMSVDQALMSAWCNDVCLVPTRHLARLGELLAVDWQLYAGAFGATALAASPGYGAILSETVDTTDSDNLLFNGETAYVHTPPPPLGTRLQFGMDGLLMVRSTCR